MNTYTNELKAQVIADILLGTLTLKDIADKHNVPYNTIKTWNSRLVKNSEIVVIETDETEKKKQIGELLLDVLEMNLDAQRSQMQKFSDLDWLDRQNAHDLAILHGVLSDKAVRLIEAFKNADNRLSGN